MISTAHVFYAFMFLISVFIPCSSLLVLCRCLSMPISRALELRLRDEEMPVFVQFRLYVDGSFDALVPGGPVLATNALARRLLFESRQLRSRRLRRMMRRHILRWRMGHLLMWRSANWWYITDRIYNE